MPARTQAPSRVATRVFGSFVTLALMHLPAHGAGELGTPAPRIMMRKCASADGSIAYQSQPCNSRAVEVWTREAPLELPRVAADLDPWSKAAAPRAATRSAVRAARHPEQPDSSRRQRCDAARIEAARKRDREWNRLRFDDLSKLDAWVAERCR